MDPAGMLLRSSLLTVAHGFSTRLGGVSEAPFAALNLGRSVGDNPDRVQENARRLAWAAGLTAGQFVSVNQVHGTTLLRVDRAPGGALLPKALADADGLWTRSPGVALSVRTADCVPVLLHAPRARAVAAIHAGWRGALAGIVTQGVERLVREAGATPEELVAAIGPAIRRCCYAVDASLAEQFRARFGEGLSQRTGEPKARLDLAEACRRSLLEAGVPQEQIDVLPHCTSCDRERFYSHRRDQGRTGRHLAFVAL